MDRYVINSDYLDDEQFSMLIISTTTHNIGNYFTCAGMCLCKPAVGAVTMNVAMVMRRIMLEIGVSATNEVMPKYGRIETQSRFIIRIKITLIVNSRSIIRTAPLTFLR